MSEVFISYRYSDSGEGAQALCRMLREWVGGDKVFIDVDFSASVEGPGEAAEKGRAAPVVFVLIGGRWLDIRDERTGARRLDDPDDSVHREVARALKAKMRVVPVLLDDAELPAEDQLPEPLKPLATLNAVSLHRNRFRDDAKHLLYCIPDIALQSAKATAHSPAWRKNIVDIVFSVIGGLATTALIGVFSQAYRSLGHAGLMLLNAAGAVTVFVLVYLLLRSHRVVFRAVVGLVLLAGLAGIYYANKTIIFGEIDSITTPTVAILVPPRFSSQTVEARMNDALAALPASIRTDTARFDIRVIRHYGVSGQPVEDSYLHARLLDNLFVRAYVVLSEESGVIRVRPVLPERQFWSALGLDGVSVQSFEANVGRVWERVVRRGPLRLSSNITMDEGFEASGSIGFSFGYDTEPGPLRVNKDDPYQSEVVAPAELTYTLYALVHYVIADSLLLASRPDAGCTVLEAAVRAIDSEIALYDAVPLLLVFRRSCLSDDPVATVDLVNELEAEGYSGIEESQDWLASFIFESGGLPLGRLNNANRESRVISIASQINKHCKSHVRKDAVDFDLPCLFEQVEVHSEVLRNNRILRNTILYLIGHLYMQQETLDFGPVPERIFTNLGVSLDGFCEDISWYYILVREERGIRYADELYDMQCVDHRSHLGSALASDHSEVYLQFLARALDVVTATEQPSADRPRADMDNIRSVSVRKVLSGLPVEWRDRMLLEIADPRGLSEEQVTGLVEWLTLIADDLISNEVWQIESIQNAKYLDRFTPGNFSSLFMDLGDNLDWRESWMNEIWAEFAQFIADLDSDWSISEAAASEFTELLRDIEPRLRDPVFKSALIRLLVNPEDFRENPYRSTLWRIADAYPEQWIVLALLKPMLGREATGEWGRLLTRIEPHAIRQGAAVKSKALLARAYEYHGDKRRSAQVFLSLSEDSDSLLRRDYYRLQARELQSEMSAGDAVCFSVAGRRVTTRFMQAYRRLFDVFDESVSGMFELPLTTVITIEALFRADGLSAAQYRELEATWEWLQKESGNEVESITNDTPGVLFRVLRDQILVRDRSVFESNEITFVGVSPEPDQLYKKLWKDAGVRVGRPCLGDIPSPLAGQVERIQE